MTDDNCGYIKDDGEPCELPACRSDDRCWHHTETEQPRNTKLTKQRQEGIANMIEQGHSQAAAARAYGIRPQTISEWKSRGRERPESIYGEFAERIARALSKSETDYVDDLRHMAEQIDDPNTLRWMLQQRFPESWGESDAIGGGGEAPPINLYNGAPEDLEQIIESRKQN